MSVDSVLCTILGNYPSFSNLKTLIHSWVYLVFVIINQAKFSFFSEDYRFSRLIKCSILHTTFILIDTPNSPPYLNPLFMDCVSVLIPHLICAEHNLLQTSY